MLYNRRLILKDFFANRTLERVTLLLEMISSTNQTPKIPPLTPRTVKPNRIFFNHVYNIEAGRNANHT